MTLFQIGLRRGLVQSAAFVAFLGAGHTLTARKQLVLNESGLATAPSADLVRTKNALLQKFDSLGFNGKPDYRLVAYGSAIGSVSGYVLGRLLHAFAWALVPGLAGITWMMATGRLNVKPALKFSSQTGQFLYDSLDWQVSSFSASFWSAFIITLYNSTSYTF